MEFFDAHRTGCRMHGKTGIRGDQDFVVHATGVGGRAIEQMRENRNPVSVLAGIDLNLVGIDNRSYRYLFTGTRLDGNRAVLIDDANADAVTSDLEMVFLASRLASRKRGEHKDDHQGGHCGVLFPVHNQSPVSGEFRIASPDSALHFTAANGPKPSHKP